ncbi:hypothetical protein [Wenjunlia tyrosinilytica]|uniref:Uncharacterized protein n=1 Tax=Wenjunlia tyrosinilytica TaxID=1544741 RepID=A0A918DV94_9ACTN|nr:hypothetical protein [Wenjunlia tyrosinilytica]GGO83550.1 hypothetical protein GCM10012280_12820 [Wenjunlia tyrosinilytica]
MGGAPGAAAPAGTRSRRAGVSASSATATYGPLLWTGATSLSGADRTFPRREAAGLNFVAAFGGNGAVPPGALNDAGTAISANSRMFTYVPYHNGDLPAQAHSAAQPARERRAPSPDPSSQRTASR